MAADLFTPIQVGSLALKNRIFMAPLLRRRTDPDNVPSELMKEYYVQRASASLIISQPHRAADVGLHGRARRSSSPLGKRSRMLSMPKGGKIFAQLWHAGRRVHPNNNDGAANPSPIAISGDVYTAKGMAPHAIPHELSVDEIAAIVGQFAAAATNAVDVVGFDGVEIHAANGYLLDQFLRTSSNKRTDIYGGALENRCRFLAEVLHAVAAARAATLTTPRFSNSPSLYGLTL
ncbi:hypothetical protein AC1031_011596 [Aphanomyces cochlioides]|nr:hypothetical protein AC1031_011596 [Aphanomyces cochlioides]